MKDLYRMSEIAEELGTNRNVIYRIIKKLDIKGVRDLSANTNTNSTLYYDEQAYLLIKEQYANVREQKKECSGIDKRTTKTNTASEAQITPDSNEMTIYINYLLERQIEALQAQINAMQITIDNQQKTISELTELLHNEQELKAKSLLVESTKKRNFLSFFKRGTK